MSTAGIKTLVVVGGSRGIGAATATLAARSGYRVVVGYCEQQAAAESVAGGIVNDGGEAVAFQLDVADCASVGSFFECVDTLWGVPDALAHCAGVRGPHGPLLDLAPEAMAGLIATNLTGTFFCVQTAAKRMAVSRGGRGGSIVVMSSEAARFGGNHISPYAASKAGINALTVGVARELAVEGIRLNAVSPGVIATELQGQVPPERHALMLASIPVGRMGHPDEVARATLWLLSDAASYVTGSILTVAGGR